MRDKINRDKKIRGNSVINMQRPRFRLCSKIIMTKRKNWAW